MTRVEHGDCLDVMRRLADEGVQVDAVVTDPPYGLEFMGKDWDSFADVRKANRGTLTNMVTASGKPKFKTKAPAFNLTDTGRRDFQSWCEEWAALALALLKPGGHLVAFGGTRTAHRMVSAIEDAGFEVRDSLCWLYGTGFSKVGYIRDPKTKEVVREGWAGSLKPAHEPICLARKPLAEPTVAAQVLATGTGALNIDGCRVATDWSSDPNARGWQGGNSRHSGAVDFGAGGKDRVAQPNTLGRWPANCAHDGSDEVLEAFARYGERRSPKPYIRGGGSASKSDAIYGDYPSRDGGINASFGDTGTAARFFYSSKASRADRAGSKHPTVKPVALMRWLCRLVTPPGGVILDPFAGSGTTGQAAAEEGFDAILIEREAEYVADIQRRLALAAPRQLELASA